MVALSKRSQLALTICSATLSLPGAFEARFVQFVRDHERELTVEGMWFVF